METLERDEFAPPVINSWRHAPTREQIRYATDLCRSELPWADRNATIATFAVLDSAEMSELIGKLAEVRDARLKRLRRSRRPKRRSSV